MTTYLESLGHGLVCLVQTCLLVFLLINFGKATEFCHEKALTSYQESVLVPYSCPSYCCEDYSPRYKIYCCTDCTKSHATQCSTHVRTGAIVGASLAAATSFMFIACATSVACYKCRTKYRKRQQRLRDQARSSQIYSFPGHSERLHTSGITDPALGYIGPYTDVGHSVRLDLNETPTFSPTPPAYSDVMEPPPPYTSVVRHHGGYMNYAGPDMTSETYI